jgi:hypothetical protein
VHVFGWSSTENWLANSIHYYVNVKLTLSSGLGAQFFDVSCVMRADQFARNALKFKIPGKLALSNFSMFVTYMLSYLAVT